MKIEAINHAYVNVDDELYDSEFINLINIKDNKVCLDENTLFLKQEIKNKLNQSNLNYYYDTIVIFERDGVYGLLGCIPISEYKKGSIKNHELVLPETIQGMMSNLYGYNSEAAPVLLLHEEAIDLKEFILHNQYSDFLEKENYKLYFYSGESANKLKSKYEIIENMFIGDGHHRMYTTSISNFKDNNLACILSINSIDLLPIHRKINNVSADEYKNAIRFIKKKFKTKRVKTDIKISKGQVLLTYRDESYLINLIDLNSDAFWNNDIFRLNTQIINQAFRIFDMSRISYISPFESMKELTSEELLLRVSPLDIEEFMDSAKSGNILPPKSTWMSFKFPSFFIMSKYQ